MKKLKSFYTSEISHMSLRAKRGYLTRLINQTNEILCDTKEMAQKGSKYYLGEPILKVRFDLKKELYVLTEIRKEL